LNRLSSFFVFLSKHHWVVLISATFGGITLLWGLWREFRGKKEWYSKIDNFRKCKREQWWREIFEIIGAGIETVVAFAFAAKDIREISPAHKQIAAKDPLNQAVTGISGVALIYLNGKEFNDLPHEAPAAGLILKQQGVSTPKWLDGLAYLESDEPINVITPQSSGRAVILHFHLNVLSQALLSQAPIVSPTVGTIVSSVNALTINTKFLRKGTEILGGSIALTINSTLRTFEIPRQMAVDVEDGFMEGSAPNLQSSLTATKQESLKSEK
jgi:hypothetical protein